MKNLMKVCTSILTGFLCLLTVTSLQASHVAPGTITNLFAADEASVGAGDFVAGAVFMNINKEVLASILQKNKEQFSLTIPFENNSKVTLNLTKQNYTAADFKVTLAGNGSTSNFDYTPALFYSGAIKGQPNALVALNFFDDKVTGVLSFGGQNYNVGPYTRGGENSFVIYRESQLDIPNPFECSTEDPVDFHMEPTTTSRSSANKKVRVYIECDNHLFKNLGGSAKRVTDFTTGLFNVVSTLYKQEDVELEVSEIKIWSTPDPYPTSSAKNARNAFGSILKGNFNGDIAHLLSNYKVNGTPPNGGSANIDVLCDRDKAVSYTNVTTSYLDYPTFSWTAYAVTHEIGHNLGSPHTHSCLWPTGPIDNCWCPEGGCSQGPEPVSSGTIMSYCHLDPSWTNSCSLSSSNPGISFSAGFGQQPGDLIRSKISQANCLQEFTAPAPVQAPFTVSAKVNDETCADKKDGNINLTLANGTGPYSYRWNTGDRNSSLANLSAGTYSVTVTDRRNQKASVNVTVKGGIELTVNAGSDKTITCDKNSIVLDASNSISGFGYTGVWTKIDGSIGGTTSNNTLTVTSAGTYKYTVTKNSTGCSASDLVVVTQEDAPNFQLQGDNITCNKPTANLSVINASPNLTYNWTGPNGFSSKVAAPIVEQEGTYTLVATNNNNCSSQQQIVVKSEQYQPNISAYGATLDCNTSQVQLSGASNEAVSYQWTGPNNFTSSEQNPSTATAGLYTLLVTTASGCTNTTTAQVGSAAAAPSIRIEGTNIACGENFTTLSAITDASNARYEWVGPNGFTSTTGQIQATEAGTYFLTVYNGSGCTNNSSHVVEMDNAPAFSIHAAAINCLNSTTTLELSNYENISYYTWTGPNNFQSTKSQPIVNRAGMYTLIATSENGCTSTNSFQVENQTTIPSLAITAGTLDCETTTTQLVASSNNTIVKYQWRGPNGFYSTLATPEVTLPGSYTLIATTDSECTATQAYQLSTNTEMPSIDLYAAAITCAQATTTLTANPVTPISAYQWKGPNNFVSNEAAPSVSQAGIYTLTATSVGGCSSVQTVEVITDNGSIDIELAATELTCSKTTAQLTATTSGNNQFFWTGPNNFQSTNQNPVVQEAGIYEVTVLAQNGCTNKRTIEVKSATTEVANILVNHDDCGNKEGYIKLEMADAGEDYYVSWNTGQVGLEIGNLSAGNYTATIKNQDGCSIVVSQEIKANAPIMLNNVNFSDITCRDANNGHIEVSVIGGLAPYQLIWSNGVEGLTNAGLSAGVHSLEVVDARNCVRSFHFEISNPEQLEVIAEIEEGEVAFFVEGGNPDYTFTWDNGLTGSYENNLANGDYSVTIEDGNGCTVVEEVNIDSFESSENIVADINTDILEDTTEDAPQSDMIYPNPADTYFNLYYDMGENTLVFISIFNAQGYYLYRSTTETQIINETIETTGWENGTYYVQLLSKDGFVTEELKVVHNN